MSEPIRIDSHPDANEYVSLRSKEMDLQAGWLGRCFGSSGNAPLNIAGLLVALLLVSGIIVLFVESVFPAKESWDTIVPLLTLALGYLFGKSGGRD